MSQIDDFDRFSRQMLRRIAAAIYGVPEDTVTIGDDHDVFLPSLARLALGEQFRRQEADRAARGLPPVPYIDPRKNPEEQKPMVELVNVPPMPAGDAKTPPDDAWTVDVCKRGMGSATCRYLTLTGDGWSCAKGNLHLKTMIDAKVLNGIFTSAGDNCTGRAES